MAHLQHTVNLKTKIAETAEFNESQQTQRDIDEASWAAGAPARAAAKVQSNRRTAYQAETDHLHFEEARGEVSEGTWAAKVAEIKARFPKD